MAYIHEFFYRFAYESLYEIHILFKLFGRQSETVVVISAVYEVFGGEFYSAFLFKVCDKYRVSGLRVAEPLDLPLLAEIIEDKRKLIEERSKPHYARFWVLFAPLFHMLYDVLLRIRKSGVVSKLFFASPLVSEIIIYLYGMPRYSRQKSYRVFVEKFTVFYLHRAFLLIRIPGFYLFARGPVVYLPQIKISIIGVELVF